MFGTTRAILQVYGDRRKDERPTTLPIIKQPENIAEEVPLSEYPYVFVRLHLPQARVLQELPLPKDMPSDAQIVTDFGFETVTIPGAIKNFSRFNPNTVLRLDVPISDFLRMLAKIGYTTAIAVLGVHGFKPSLADYIRTPGGEVNLGTHYIGGAYSFGKSVSQIGSGEYAHEAVPQRRLLRERGWVVIRIQLFIPIGGVYDVFVGTL